MIRAYEMMFFPRILVLRMGGFPAPVSSCAWVEYLGGRTWPGGVLQHPGVRVPRPHEVVLQQVAIHGRDEPVALVRPPLARVAVRVLLPEVGERSQHECARTLGTLNQTTLKP